MSKNALNKRNERGAGVVLGIGTLLLMLIIASLALNLPRYYELKAELESISSQVAVMQVLFYQM